MTFGDPMLASRLEDRYRRRGGGDSSTCAGYLGRAINDGVRLKEI